MKTYRSELERLTPRLRQFARALVEDGRQDVADELVHDAMSEALRVDQGAAASQAENRVYARLVAANRLRLRQDVAERRSAPGAAGDRRAAPPSFASAGCHGLDSLPIGDREALLLVVIGRLDYADVADILGLPLATLIARLVEARDRLGDALWSGAGGRGQAGPRVRPAQTHLRLVKS